MPLSRTMQAEGVASAAGKPRAMSGLGSRVAISVVGLPLVLGVVYLGGWWLFGADKYFPAWIIFIGKVYFFYLGLIWLRGNLS